MQIVTNWWAVIVSAVIAMVLGAIWFGPLFGKKYMEISGISAQSMERREAMKKESMKFWVIQFVLSLFQAWVLSWFIKVLASIGISGGVHTAFGIWAAFVMPTMAAGAMWNADSAKVKWAKFLLMAGQSLILFLIIGWILGSW